jgi:FMN-dependent dehydrogenase
MLFRKLSTPFILESPKSLFYLTAVLLGAQISSRAIALGAGLCFGDRATLWELASNGQDGVEEALEILKSEFVATMGLAGTRNLAEITRNHLRCVKPGGGIQPLPRCEPSPKL